MLSLQEKLVRVVICDDIKVEEAPLLVEEVRKQRLRCGAGLYYVAVIPEEAPMPDTAVRNAMTEGLRVIQGFCDYAALVFCGTGLKATMKRTAFAGMLMLIMKGRWHVANSVEELIRKSGGDLNQVTHLRIATKLAAEKGFRV